MNKNKAAAGLIYFGLLIIISAILIDILKTGVLKIQAAQILAIEIGLLLTLLGLAFRQAAAGRSESDFIYSGMVKALKGIPMTTWVMAGYLISYFACFIIPVFFKIPPRMQYYNKYLPDGFPIGGDLLLVVDLARQWLVNGQAPFHIQFYPPLTYFFLSPLVLISDTNVLFRVVTIITIFCFVLSSLVIPLLMIRRGDRFLIYMFFVSGLFSYGMQFELERGQVNVLAFLFSISAIYIYHHHHAFRRYAYLLFSLAVQLKLYPAIFVVMLVKDWRDWKGNLRRAVLLGLFNFALLFVGGIRAFREFASSVLMQMKNPGWSWTGNHSIKAFLSEFIENKGFGLVNTDTLMAIQKNSALISFAFLAVFMLAFLSALILAYRRNEGGFDGALFMTCTIGAWIIPISNDYTLSIAAAPAAMAFTAISARDYGRYKIPAAIFLTLASAAFSFTLYPFTRKALFIQNSFPALFILLLAITALNQLMTDKKTAQESSVL
jgi:hypothetical protein